MSNKQLLIPKKIAVGFQNRNDTYTKKLAYVIYYDIKNVLRKEKSWNSWRDHKISPVDYDNEPTEGFVLNRKVGGYKSHWNFRDAHVRVFDPRGFEFEISVPNLLFILKECDCSRGKGLEGKFVYAWEGTELILLPVSSEDYTNSQSYTLLQTQSVKAKDLVPGSSYITKKQEVLTYVGKYDYYTIARTGYKPVPAFSKQYVWWNGKQNVFTKDVKTIAGIVQPDTVPDLAELIQNYLNSTHGSKPYELFLKDKPKSRLGKKYGGRSAGSWFYQDVDGSYLECYSCYASYEETNRDVVAIQSQYRYVLKDGELASDYHSSIVKNPSVKSNQYNHSYYANAKKISWCEPTEQELWARLESGKTFRVSNQRLIDPAQEKLQNQLQNEDYDGEED